MRKIHVTRQFFEASGRHIDFFEKTKNPFLDKIYGSMCTKFQVLIVSRLARRRDTNKYINAYTHIQVKLGISKTGCSPHVDFDISHIDFNFRIQKIFATLNSMKLK